ncbi:hypothetical protein [Mycobacteroides abscessus]|uniref:hypothetical protein n=1 Tax=Mycobacteroides abscessus TaxID=36809 RepID=UPI001C65A78D
MVCVIRAGKRWLAECTCGNFAPRSRFWRAAAVLDAQQHAAGEGCELSWPLVIPVRGLDAVGTARIRQGRAGDVRRSRS